MQRANMDSRIIYPAIKEWFEKNGHSFESMGREAGVTGRGLMYFLRGERNGTKMMVDAVLAVTGMTYEEAFRME